MENEIRTSNGRGITLDKLMKDLKIVVEDGQELLKSGASHLREKASKGAKFTDESLHRNPYPSMAIIFGLGLALGLLSYNLLQGSEREYVKD